jgi:phosphatidylserine/phosphatidylglycerophosphate/cardiolipin synthase-like enzyme
MKKIKKLIIVLLFLLIGYTAIGIYHSCKKMPPGTDYASPEYSINADQIEFLYDLTYTGEDGERKHQQVIFDRIFDHIESARHYILIDMFLFNSYGAGDDKVHRALADELTERLIAKKAEYPELAIDLITDQINIVYGGGRSSQIESLRSAGVNVVFTDLRKLRDGNFLYSPLWRSVFQFARNSEGGWIRHPFSSSEPNVTLRSYLTMLNFKANHRKVFVADDGEGAVSIISSANPHNGSSAHSNVAFLVKGQVAEAIYGTEEKVAAWSGGALSGKIETAPDPVPENGAVIRVLTEKRIKESLLQEIADAGPEDKIRIAQFYLADRQTVRALLAASKRGADIRLILDANKDAFGYKKIGIPNQPAAHELVARSAGRIEVRWYDTHGEQFHSKLFFTQKGDRVKALIGSANLTRRNLENYNLELNIFANMPADNGAGKAIIDYYERIWNDQGGTYTVDYEKHEDSSGFKTLVYRIQENLGLSSF